MPPIRVFVVEDQIKILKSQLKLLESQPGLELVGTALSGEAALDEIPAARPNVVLLDLGLPRMSGIDVTRALRATLPEVEILIFTIFDEEDRVLEAIRAGASGYLLKGAPAERIAEAIREVHAGGTVIQPNLARRLLRHFRAAEAEAAAATSSDGGPPSPTGAVGTSTTPKDEEPLPDPPPLGAAPAVITTVTRPLSDREKEILQLIAKGVSNNEAANLLGLSKATIRTHLEHIYEKLEVTNRVEAVTEGIRKGLISV